MSRILVPSALALAVFAVSNAYAADNLTTENSQQLPVIVVTASKTPEPIDQVPARISVIDEKTIQQSPVNDLPGLLQREAALNIVQLGGYGQQTSVFTRGTNSSHTLFLKDGVRLNPLTSSITSTQYIDTTDVTKIEVLKGPASVQYGSDAIGGVVQLISEAPKKTRVFTTAEAGEENTYKAIVGADLVQNDFYFQVRGQRLETDGSEIKDTATAKQASYDQKGYSAKAGIENEKYQVSAEIGENKGAVEYDMFGSMTSQDFLNRFINLKGGGNITDNVIVNARLSQFEDQLTQNDLTYLYDFNYNLIGQEIDYTNSDTQEADVNVQWKFTPHQNLLLGATTRSTDVDSLSYGTKYDETLDTTGYYLQHQYQNNGISTQAGLRVEDNKQFGTHTVGQLAGRIQVAPLTSIYANIGTAFKAPTANDLYGYSGNPNLEPEESVSYEIGVDQKLAFGITSYLSVYQTQIKNLINSDPTTYQQVNIDKAKLTGGELGFKWQKDAWFVNTEYAYVQPKDDKTDQDLSRRPRNTGTLTLGWDDGQYGVSASLVAKSKSDNSGFDNVKVPGFVSASLNTYWQFNPHGRFFVNIKNIGDSTYKTAYGSGSYYIAAPRLATAGVTLSY